MIWGCDELIASLEHQAVCSRCFIGKLSLAEKPGCRQGWRSSITWICSNADCMNSQAAQYFPTSKSTNNAYDINRLLVLGMRAIGKGRAAADKVSAYLQLSPPLAQRHWCRHTKVLQEKVKDITEETFEHAALKLKRLKLADSSSVNIEDVDAVRDAVVDVAVSVDGSWLTRGYYSRHAFVSVISVDTGVCLDRAYLCSTCRACKRWEGKSKTSGRYMTFFEEHFPECPLNHDGSSQSMEPEGAEQLFCRSLEKHNLRYTTYIGDGDSKSFQRVIKAQPYGPDVTIVKEECVGHAQKRMGTRLRTLVNKKKGIKLDDGKPLSGKGRLTQKRIDSFQVFYGVALRSNKGDLDGMCRSTRAILSHYSSTTDDPQHDDCPPGRTSWCKWQLDRATGKTTYKPPKHPISPAIAKEIQPIFDELSDETLLQACLNGQTQNQNESLHHLIWSCVPKDQYHAPSKVQLGIDMSVLLFNQGTTATVTAIFSSLGLDLMTSSKQMFIRTDKRRIRDVSYQAGEKAKQARKKRRHEKINQLDAFEKDEETSYLSGAFHSGMTRERKCRKCQKPMKGHP